MTEPGAPTASDQRPMTPAEWRRRCEVALRVIEAEPRRPWRWRVVAAGRAAVKLLRSRITLYLIYVALAASSAGMLVSNVDWQSRLQVTWVIRGMGIAAGAIIGLLSIVKIIDRLTEPSHDWGSLSGRLPSQARAVRLAVRGRDKDWGLRHAIAKWELESPPPDPMRMRLSFMAQKLGQMRVASEAFPQFGIDIARCEQSVRELAEAVGVDPEPIIRNSSGSIDLSIDLAWKEVGS